jgi:hypothetical protein
LPFHSWPPAQPHTEPGWQAERGWQLRLARLQAGRSAGQAHWVPSQDMPGGQRQRHASQPPPTPHAVHVRLAADQTGVEVGHTHPPPMAVVPLGHAQACPFHT